MKKYNNIDEIAFDFIQYFTTKYPYLKSHYLTLEERYGMYDSLLNSYIKEFVENNTSLNIDTLDFRILTYRIYKFDLLKIQ